MNEQSCSSGCCSCRIPAVDAAECITALHRSKFELNYTVLCHARTEELPWRSVYARQFVQTKIKEKKP